jgi:hypothetical protein
LDEPGVITIELTDGEHAALRRLQLLDLDCERVVWGACRDNGRLLMTGTDEEFAGVLSSIVRITGGNFRLVERLFAQIQRVAQINELATLTRELVETAQESLVVGTS